MKYWYYIPIFFAIALQILATYTGLGITHDSVHYLSAAQTWAQQGEMRSPDGSLYQVWTPLFPIFIAIIGNKNLANTNTILLLITLLLWVRIANFQLKSKILHFIFIWAIVSNVMYLLCFTFRWSEPLFFTLLALHFSLLSKNFPLNLKTLTLLACTDFLLCLQRNAGVFFVIATGLFLIVMLINTKKQRLFFNFLGIIFYQIVSFAGWATWTYFVGSQNSNLTSFAGNISTNIYQYTHCFSLWFLPLNIPFVVRAGFMFSLLTMLFIINFKVIKKINFSIFQILILTNLFVYVSFLLIGGVHGIEDCDRILIAIFPLIMLYFFISLDKILNKLTKKVKNIVYLCLILLLIYPSIRTAKNMYFRYKVMSNQTINTLKK